MGARACKHGGAPRYSERTLTQDASGFGACHARDKRLAWSDSRNQHQVTTTCDQPTDQRGREYCLRHRDETSTPALRQRRSPRLQVGSPDSSYSKARPQRKSQTTAHEGGGRVTDVCACVYTAPEAPPAPHRAPTEAHRGPPPTRYTYAGRSEARLSTARTARLSAFSRRGRAARAQGRAQGGEFISRSQHRGDSQARTQQGDQ